jgi:hypothetical protein
MNAKDRNRQIADRFQESSSVVYKIYEPLWHARSDTLKTLISVASGAIVLSVTFSSSLKALNVGLFWRCLLLFSFIMFAISLISALTSLRVGVGLHGIQADMLAKRTEVQNTISKVDASAENIMEPFMPILDGINGSIENRDKWAGWLFDVGFMAFAVAIISLVIIGVRQFIS